MKRKGEASLVQSPSIDENDASWIPSRLVSLTRSVSPPSLPSRSHSANYKSLTAQVEAGERDVDDHLSFFSSKLLAFSRLHNKSSPRISHESWINLYTGNDNRPDGHHFVVHQHDHPVAGTHYDLRLQCNSTRSVSWAIMYGLPGDPNSRRLNRNATETRIHCLWNHLIETASHQTGTLLIWDTGTYEILPYRDTNDQVRDITTDEEGSEHENHSASDSAWTLLSEPQKLHQAFQNRRIRLRLHGNRLPKDYTLSLWLRSENDRAKQPAAPKSKRRKSAPSMSGKPSNKMNDISNSDRGSSPDREPERIPTSRRQLRHSVSSLRRHESPPLTFTNTSETQKSTTLSPSTIHNHSDSISAPSKTGNTTLLTPNEEEEQIRITNAYTGATNSINSIHQRRWFLCLDRQNSGFARDRATGTWIADSSRIGPDVERGCPKQSRHQHRHVYPFHVLGRDHERSVVTGRLAHEILKDEGVVGFVPRGKWRAVTE